MRRLIIIAGCTFVGALLFNLATIILYCDILNVGGNLCGLPGMLYGMPLGALIGSLVGFIGRRTTRSAR